MRALFLFIIGLTFGFGGGFLTAGGLGPSSHDHAGHGDMAHDMSMLTDWTGTAPNLSLHLTPDSDTTRNLHIQTVGFTFTPEAVNGPVTQGTGHAHVYLNGTKIARAYGPNLHLDGVNSGDLLRVTLNANDHSQWGLNGQPIATEITIP